MDANEVDVGCALRKVEEGDGAPIARDIVVRTDQVAFDEQRLLVEQKLPLGISPEDNKLDDEQERAKDGESLRTDKWRYNEWKGANQRSRGKKGKPAAVDRLSMTAPVAALPAQ